jgi:plastocyanin domain-containing protein
MKSLGLAILLMFLLGGAAFAATPEKKTFQATIGQDGVQHVDIVGGEYFFDPYRIIVKVNVPVRLSVRKVGGVIPVPHNIMIKAPEAGIDFNIDMDKEAKIVAFTPTKTGSYPIICNKKLLFFASHQEKGMEGVLEVVE